MLKVHILVALILSGLATGCASQPVTTHTGFISDYSRMVSVDSHTARYVSPKFHDYSRFTIDPIQSRLTGDVLSPSEKAEALQYMHDSCKAAFTAAGFTLAEGTGPDVARVRLALTDVAKSVWWEKVHPASRALGAGTGGAAMECEVIDSMTGEQLVAAVQAASGNQFNITAYSTLADVKSAIDKWTQIATQRLTEIKAGRLKG